MGYSIDNLSDDCYEGTSCLINKFNIKDESVLNDLEAAVTLEKIAELEVNPPMLTFGVEHY